MKFLFPALCWAVLLGGFACAKKPKPVPATPPAPQGVPFEEDTPMPDPDETVLRFGDPKAPTSPIFFDFDSFSLKEAYKVAALAEYLKVMPGWTVDLRGHASQEGTEDYNLALGAKRAQAVRGYLEACGISENRITWTSMGEEMPVSHDPVSFSLNRRVNVFLEEPK